MNRLALRTTIAAVAAAPLVALGAGVAAAAPTLHGDPDTPGTQLNIHSNSPHSFTCGAIGVTGVGIGSAPANGSGPVNGAFFGDGPAQGGCVGDDGSIYFPAGHAH
ncbi:MULTISPECIES: hypothetical protein [unclassified Rhodococcus (in: high G+C Gram-positive bacteria)]|uniref:hypothetical protein n=1 Tax=unclassified Rhodococcus (in: high G+C Gram-positive bacteria) TaxID=192944 RepID=UPI001639E426|nr:MULTISPECIES: hypothetical protein [unclassified Rhodococcus (in: high G+C Gram-positive bacteria)]MBC2644171.1 hypothetical protein [Rhodococcus sp. 3A]MBC2891090.1 hypothetical protein [Rhodococcus sp. 4CII]